MKCNQCMEEMELEGNNKRKTVNCIHFVCHNPKCPNYALLQIPLEDMIPYKNIRSKCAKN